MSNKSEATWHPNSGPATDHTDLTDRPWQAGDPCASCGSTRTYWSDVFGGQCLGCGRGDDDE